jgi:hypothetical protein
MFGLFAIFAPSVVVLFVSSMLRKKNVRHAEQVEQHVSKLKSDMLGLAAKDVVTKELAERFVKV